MLEFSLSDLNRHSGELADVAIASPILLKKHGRPHLVLMSIEHYGSLETGSRPTGSQPQKQAVKQRPRSKLSTLSTQYRHEVEEPGDY